MERVKEDNSEAQRSGLLALSHMAYRTPETFHLYMTPAHRKEVLPYLVEGMDHPEVGVRIRFIELLGHLRERSVVPELTRLLEHDNPTIRQFAATALGRIGDGRAIPPLMQMEANDPAQDQTGHYYLRERARDALAQIRTGNPG